jgi:hypothetical protein
MKNTEQKKDKDGYILLPEVFEHKRYLFEFVEDLSKGWKIYKKTRILTKRDIKNKEVVRSKYELVLPSKNEEWSHGKNVTPKKYSYPGDSSFGKTGFDCISLEAARARHKQVLEQKEAKEELKERKLNIPLAKEFTVKDLVKLNKDWTKPQITTKIYKLLDEKRIKVVGEIKNKSVNPSKIYKYVK